MFRRGGATGRVTNQAAARHRASQCLALLNLLARTYPRRPIPVVLDNVSAHKTPEVERWLARHKRFHFHFTPTSASWMNQIETWFGILSRQAIRRGSFATKSISGFALPVASMASSRRTVAALTTAAPMLRTGCGGKRPDSMSTNGSRVLPSSSPRAREAITLPRRCAGPTPLPVSPSAQ